MSRRKEDLSGLDLSFVLYGRSWPRSEINGRECTLQNLDTLHPRCAAHYNPLRRDVQSNSCSEIGGLQFQCERAVMHETVARSKITAD